MFKDSQLENVSNKRVQNMLGNKKVLKPYKQKGPKYCLDIY